MDQTSKDRDSTALGEDRTALLVPAYWPFARLPPTYFTFLAFFFFFFFFFFFA